MSIVAAVMVPHPPVIIPEVGRGREREVLKTTEALSAVMSRLAALEPETVVVLSPHSINYADYFHISPGASASGDIGDFGAPGVRIDVDYDEEFVRELSELADENEIDAGTLGERSKKLDHATMVPLYFLRAASAGGLKCKFVRVALSGLPLADHYRLGMLISEAAGRLGRKTAVIASGDLSHVLKEEGPYGFREQGPEYDRRVMDVMGRAAFGELFDFPSSFCEKAAECGHRSFVIMAGCFDRLAVKAEKLSYEGTFGVGYGVCFFTPAGADSSRAFLDVYLAKQSEEREEARQSQDAYVRLARRTIEEFVRAKNVIDVPRDIPEEMLSERAGVFVSLKKFGMLRGCIGTIAPATSSVAEEIIRNAIGASTEDPRFPPVQAGELDDLDYSVDVLGAPEAISSAGELDVKKYGVIVSKGYRRGLLLPNLDGVDTVEEQLDIAMQKAGIAPDESGVKLERFEVVRHY